MQKQENELKKAIMRLEDQNHHQGSRARRGLCQAFHKDLVWSLATPTRVWLAHHVTTVVHSLHPPKCRRLYLSKI